MTMRYVEIASDDLQREFRLARSHPRHLWPHSREHQSLPPAPAWMACLTLCSLLNTRSRCFADLSQTALPGTASTAYPIG